MKQTLESQRDALYIAWSEDRQTAAPTPLRDWIARHPAHAEELARWAVDTPLLDCAAQRPADLAAEAHTLAIGRQVVAEMRARYLTVQPAPLKGLLETAKACGLTPKALAERLGVGLSTVAKLQQRHFRFASLPAEIIARAADALQVSVGQVRAYLQQPPTLAAGASYKSDSVPRAAAQEEFAQAIRSSRDMTEEQKAYWFTQTENTTGE